MHFLGYDFSRQGGSQFIHLIWNDNGFYKLLKGSQLFLVNQPKLLHEQKLINFFKKKKSTIIDPKEKKKEKEIKDVYIIRQLAKQLISKLNEHMSKKL